MTIARVNALGWGYLELLLSGQITQLDINATYALDSRGGTYTLTDPLVLNGNVQIQALFRSDSQSPWPDYSTLTNGDHTIIPRQIINVYDLIDLTTTRNLVLSRSSDVIDGNIQIFHGVSGAFGVPIFDNSTGTQIAVAIQNGIVITQFRNAPSAHYTAIYAST